MPKLFKVEIVSHGADDVRFIVHYDNKTQIVRLRERLTSCEDAANLLCSHFSIFAQNVKG